MNLNLIKSSKVYVIIIVISVLSSLYSFEAFLNYKKNENRSLKLKKELLLEKENKVYDERTIFPGQVGVAIDTKANKRGFASNVNPMRSNSCACRHKGLC